MDHKTQFLQKAKQQGLDAKIVIRCFVSMPFSGQWDDVWFKGIQGCSEKLTDYQLDFRRADREPFIQRHVEYNVLQKIDDADLLIADVSLIPESNGPNSSVMHEIGYAAGKNMPIIYIGLKDSHKHLPSNLVGSILVEYEISKMDKFIGELTSQLKETINSKILSSIRGDFTVQCFTNRNRIGIPRLIENARQRVQIITTNLQYEYTNLKESIDKALDLNKENPDFKIEILTMDPEGDTVSSRAAQLGKRTRQYRDELRQSLEAMYRAYSENPKVDIVTYTSLPTQITLVIDDTPMC